MDRWKAEMGRVREKRRVEERRAEERRSEKRKNQKREDAGAWKGRKVAVHCVAAEGRKVGSLKRRVRSHVVRWEMKSCTQLWREADFQVKMYKAPHVRTTFGSWDVEKVHGVVAQSTCPSQNVQSTPCSVHFQKLRCWKVHAVVARSTFRSNNVQNTTCSDHFWTFRCHFAWGAGDCLCTLSKVSKTWGFRSSFKNDGRRETFEEDLQRCISRGRRNARNMFIRNVRRSGCWLLEMGCILEHQIFSFGKMILCDKFSTSYDPASLFRGSSNTLDTWTAKSQNALSRGRQLCTQLSIIIRRKSRRIASFLMFPTSKLEEASQTCFVFDVIKFRSWGSLSELLRFSCCHLRKWRTSLRIALFSSLQIDK